MTRRASGRAAAPALLLALALAGCGAGTEAGDKDKDEELGPLSTYLEQAYGEWDEDQGDRDMMRMEELVAECMAEQGFEYIPVDQSQGGISLSSDDLDVEWGSREFAEQYGYGITIDPFADLHEEAGPAEEFVDPNAEYVEAMSEAEMEAYYLALFGNQEMPEDADAEFEYDWEQNGCQGRAQHDVFESAADDPAIASLEEEMTALWERTMEDPRITGATTEWIDCMGDAGYTGLATVDDAQMQFNDRSNAIYEEAYPADPAAMSSEEDFAKIEARVQEQLAELRDEEIATAVADFECREEARFEETMREVSFELEQEFVDTHRAELEAWVEAVTASRG